MRASAVSHDRALRLPADTALGPAQNGISSSS